MKRLLRMTLNRIGFDIVRTSSQHGHLKDHLANILKANSIDCVIDVGANRGQYGKMLRSLGYAGRIVSYEPVAAVYAELEKAAAADPAWSCHRAALGEVAEQKTINVYSSSVFSSFLPASEYSKGIWKSLEKVEPETVEVVRLDEVYDDHVRSLGVQNVMLKLDTQGFDLQAFRGTGSRINDIAVLQSEISMLPVYDQVPTYREVLPEYENQGFRVSGLYPINRDSSMAVIEFDCLMVRPNLPALGA